MMQKIGRDSSNCSHRFNLLAISIIGERQRLEEAIASEKAEMEDAFSVFVSRTKSHLRSIISEGAKGADANRSKFRSFKAQKLAQESRKTEDEKLVGDVDEFIQVERIKAEEKLRMRLGPLEDQMMDLDTKEQELERSEVGCELVRMKAKSVMKRK